jgi:ATP synthase protein I
LFEIKESVVEEKPQQEPKRLARFAGLGAQMAAVIGGLTWLGFFLDGKYNHGGKAWTISLSLFGVVVALYQVIREVINMSKDN